MWGGVAGAAAILPALFLGFGHGGKATIDTDPVTTGSISVPAPLSASGAPSAAPVAAGPAQPLAVDRVGALALIRNVLIAVQQANETGNYTVLRDLGSPAFQSANTASRLSDIFSGLRTRSLDLSPAAAVDPQITVAPELNADGTMHVAGLIPASPAPVAFDLVFAAVEGRWMPFSISIALAPPPTTPPTVEKRPDTVPAKAKEATRRAQ